MKWILEKLGRYFQKRWHIGVLDEKKGRWIIEATRWNLGYLKAENARGRHILLKPDEEVEPEYLLVDDVSCHLLEKHHQDIEGRWRPGRLVVETSPGNYQVWIHSSRKLCLSEKRYWLKKLFSDPGADPNNRYGRCPGFRNRKQKYRTPQGDYPLSRLIWIDWARRATIPKPNLPEATRRYIPDFPQPERGVCRICRADFVKGDASATDFAFALALARRGYTFQEIKMLILTQRVHWHNHLSRKKRDEYLKRTIRKAIDIIQRS